MFGTITKKIAATVLRWTLKEVIIPVGLELWNKSRAKQHAIELKDTLLQKQPDKESIPPTP